MAAFDLGRITPIYRGDYSASVSYELNDIVLYTDGCLYWHTKATATTGVAPTDTETWTKAFDGAGVRNEIQAIAGSVANAVSTANGHKDAAKSSADSASHMASIAGRNAAAAEASATAAAGSATDAAGAANSAASSAVEAVNASTAAAGSAERAAQSESRAEGYSDAAAASKESAAASAASAAESESGASHYADVARQGAEEAGYVFFNVDVDSGLMAVTITDNIKDDITFAVNEAAGTLEVTV